MLSKIKHHFTLSALLLLGFTNYTFAAANLPVSSQSSEEEKIEVVEEIQINIQASTSPSNPALKQGDACSDEDLENLEEAKGEFITIVPAIPMAKTIPCDTTDCKDLAPAKMQSYTVRKLPPKAKIIKCKK